MNTEHRSGGFVKAIILILFGVGLLVWFQADIRSLIASPETRKATLIKIDAHTEAAWYGFLAWYDGTSKTFGPLRWVQGRINAMAGRLEGPNASTTKEMLDE